MTTSSPEVQSPQETTETLEQRIERLEKGNAELKAENEKLKSQADQWNLKGEIAVNRLYKFWAYTLDGNEVENVLNNLNGDHKTKIEDFIKNNKIEDLQKYLNGLIDSWAINKEQLINNCNEKWIWLRDWHIFEDWKFWPQTFEAIKSLTNLSAWWESWSIVTEQSTWASVWNGDVKEQSQTVEVNETIGTFSNRKCRIRTIDSVDGLPSDYKRKDPENYDPSNKDTYPILYYIKQWNNYIICYNNGRCKWVDWNMYNTKDIVERLKNGSADEKEYWSDLYLHRQSISDLLKWKEFLIGGKKDTIWVTSFGNKIRFYLNSWKHTNRKTSQGDYVGTTETTSTYEYYKDLSAWDLLDKNWKFDKNYFQNVVLIQVQKELESQYKANAVVNWLLNVRKKWYSMTDIFGNEHEGETKYLKYFQQMDSITKKITFDDIRRDGTNIKFSLDNDGSNKDYNKLSVKYTELADNNGDFSEKKLKQYLKKKVKEIIDKNF